MTKLIVKTIEEHKSEIIKFCQQLVKTPSQNGIDNEHEIAKAISSKLKELGIKYKLIGNKKRPSILAFIGRNNKKSFILNAHTDTVVIGDKGKWKYGPFSGKIINGKLYGRGSADCKAGIAAIIYAAYSLLKVRLDGQLVLAFDSDEESLNYTGMKQLLAGGLKGDACLITYPGNEELMIGSRGQLKLVVNACGKAAHTGSRKKKGINAITKMAEVIQILESLKLKYEEDPYFRFGPRVTVSQIEGGTAFNIVPDRCKITVDIRTLPSQTKEKILKQIKNAIKTQAPNLKFSLEEELYSPAYRISENEKIIKIVLESSKEILNRQPKIACSGGSNSGKLLWEKGTPVICGFGVSFKNVHSYNECIYIKSLINITKIYALTALNFLKKGRRKIGDVSEF